MGVSFLLPYGYWRGVQMSHPNRDTGDLLIEAEADGYEDTAPEPVQDPDDPSYVEPSEDAVAVEDE